MCFEGRVSVSSYLPPLVPCFLSVDTSLRPKPPPRAPHRHSAMVHRATPHHTSNAITPHAPICSLQPSRLPPSHPHSPFPFLPSP